MDELVEVRSNTDTRIITIIVQHPDADTAVGIANSISDSLVNLNPAAQDISQPTLAQLQIDIDVLQQTVLDTQTYIELLETELDSLQAQTQNLNLEEIALIEQYHNLEDEFSLERSRLSNALRTQGSNFGTLNDARWATSRASSIMHDQLISHIDVTEKLIQDSSSRVDRLETEINKLDSDFDYTSYYLTLSVLDRQSEIKTTLSQERARLGDQIRTLSMTIEIFSTLGSKPNQVTLIEPAGSTITVNDFLAIKVGAAAVAGLVAALIIVIFAENLRPAKKADTLKVS
jgi:peptidoglycan hydrolase CwlO-like protein